MRVGGADALVAVFGEGDVGAVVERQHVEDFVAVAVPAFDQNTSGASFDQFACLVAHGVEIAGRLNVVTQEQRRFGKVGRDDVGGGHHERAHGIHGVFF